MEDKQVDWKSVAMIRGLVRAAEAMEQDPIRAPGGKIWDDAMRIGLELAREYGWGKHQIGTIPHPPVSGFEKELTQLLNKHSQENGSNTPDFVLASYLQCCLDNWNLHTRERDRWWGNRSVLGVANEVPPVQTSGESLLR